MCFTVLSIAIQQAILFGRFPVQQLEFELAVGESIQVGDQLLTVIDVGESEISVRIDSSDPGFPHDEEFVVPLGVATPV